MLPGSGHGEIYVSLDLDGNGQLGVMDIDVAYLLSFGVNERGPFFQCLSEKKPLFRGKPINPSPDHRHYLDAEWELPVLFAFPKVPGVHCVLGRSMEQRGNKMEFNWDITFFRCRR